jgi:hypothetical protein
VPDDAGTHLLRCGGFGYDSIFVPDHEHQTLAEMPRPATHPGQAGRFFAGISAPIAVRTRVRRPQTNGEGERFLGTLRYEHLYRATIGDGHARRRSQPLAEPAT